MSRVQKLQEEIAHGEHRMVLDRESSRRLALRLADNPQDAEAAAALRELEDGIQSAERTLKHLRGALEAAEKRDAVDQRAVEREAIKTAFDSVMAALEERKALAAEIEAAVSKLGNLSTAYGVASAACVEATAEVLRRAVDTEYRLLNAHLWVELAHGSSGAVHAAFVGALHSAGIGKVGIRVPQLLDIGFGLIQSKVSLAEAVAIDADRLQYRLEEFIDRKHAEHAALDSGTLNAQARMKERAEQLLAERSLRLSRVDDTKVTE